jgi:hypothetical protein
MDSDLGLGFVRACLSVRTLLITACLPRFQASSDVMRIVVSGALDCQDDVSER